MSILWIPRCEVGHHLRISSLRVGATLQSENQALGRGLDLGLLLVGDVVKELGKEEKVSSIKGEGGSQSRDDT